VLDLGSGAGFDALLAARRVGPDGHVIGVDMTPEMIATARENARRSGATRVDFQVGEIEHLPVADASIDVVLSNCVINLSPDKPAVFREAFRVLKPGGRLAISDLVAMSPLPEAIARDLAAHTGCIAGAALVDDLRAMLVAAGFGHIRIAVAAGGRELVTDLPEHGGAYVASASIQAIKPAEDGETESLPCCDPDAEVLCPSSCCGSYAPGAPAAGAATGRRVG
jgi:arsenite methyltransferase